MLERKPEWEALEKEVAGFFESMGYRIVTVAFGPFLKLLPCGLLMCVRPDLRYTERPRVKIAAHVPDPQNSALEGKRATDAMESIVRRGGDWKDRVQARLAQVAKSAEEVARKKCPLCGSFMVERIVRRKKEHRGKRFLGCAHYPLCRGFLADWASEPSSKFTKNGGK